MDAIRALHTNMRKTLACCGLDPDWEKLPHELTISGQRKEGIIFKFVQEIIDIAASHVCAFKIQKAFFDLWPNGHDLLKNVIAYIHGAHPNIPVILDCKIGDIDNTMKAYMQNIFEHLSADGVVVNPYMGEAVLRSFEAYPQKAIVVLVKTSNPDGSIIQDLRLNNGNALWEEILSYVTKRWNTKGNMIPVISSTTEIDLVAIRKIIPDEMPILFAGAGKQGGKIAEMSKLLNSQNSGVFVNSSRDLLYPRRKPRETWQQATERSVVEFKKNLEKIRIGE